MIGFLIFIHTLVSILLIGIILMQSSQGSGLSGTFGGNTASNVLGGQNAGNILSKITSWLASVFIILAIFISTLSGPAERSGSSSIIKQAAEDRNQENFNPIDPNQDAVLDLNEKHRIVLLPKWRNW